MNMKKYTFEEVFEASKNYFNGDELAAGVFVGKYALQNNDGEYLELTPNDMHQRLAREFARVEANYSNPMSEEEIFDLLKDFKHIVPQGSPMSAIGNPYKLQSLSNCFVIPGPLDSYASILTTDQEQAQIMKRRGGVGFDISNIRPKGMKTANAAGTTDGIAVFMERFSNTTREVAQGGRRGALMLTIDICHPEIETFINIKRNLKKVTGANISIRLNDEFMNAVKNDREFTLRWPTEVSVENAKVTKVVQAKNIWDQIIDSAWSSAEPGLLFWDTVKRETPSDLYEQFQSVSTNPCGEIILDSWGACRLLLINLTSYIDEPFQKNASFNYDKFFDHAIKAQRLMDDLVDLELEAVDKIIAKIDSDPEPSNIKRIEHDLWVNIRNSGRDNRRTGLGITGLGDAIAMLNVKYGSEMSIDVTEKIYKTLAIASHKSSVKMASERGAFPACIPGIGVDVHPFMKRLADNSDQETNDLYLKVGRRNIALTTTAPAGSVSTLTQTTSGIEPAYLLSYTRRKKINPNDLNARVDFVDDLGDKWQEFNVYHHGVKQWMDVTNETDITKSPYYGATSSDVNWKMSVDLQAVAQRWIEHSLSKTCNLPNHATKELVSEVYMRAWEKGCKGFTVYRDGCRSGVLVNSSSEEKNTFSQPMKLIENHAPRRHKDLTCDIHQVNIKGEKWTVIVGLMENKPYEVFGGLSQYIEIPKKQKRGILTKNGKKDGLATYNLSWGTGDDVTIVKDIVNVFENVTYGVHTRMISLSLRHGIPVQYVVEQLNKDKYSDMQSFSRVIARVLKGYIPDGTKVASVCPNKDCNGENTMMYQEGCVRCMQCGFSKC